MEPEGSDRLDVNGQPIYLRAMFPGLPFRDNDPNNPVCTPSLKDAAAASTVDTAAALLVALAAVAAVTNQFVGWR